MRKINFIISLLFIFAVSIVSAQDAGDCQQLTQDAIGQLQNAQTAFDNDDSNTAFSHIEDAKATLSGCDTTIVEADNPDNEENVASNQPKQEDSDNDESHDTAKGNFVINTPEVNPEQAIAFLRFANLSPDVGSLDFYLSNQGTPIVENISFGEVTDLIALNGSNLTIIARPAGSGSEGEQVGSLNWDFTGNSSWIVSGIGYQSEYSFFVEPVSIVRNNYDGRARVRTINFITDKQRATVRTHNDITLADGINWVGMKDVMVDEGDYTLSAELEDGTVIDELVSTNFEANNTYLILLLGMDGEEPVKAVILKNSADVTRLKFISQRSSDVDVYAMPMSQELVTPLLQGEETEWITVPSGALTLTLFEPDAGSDSQEIAAISRQLRPGRDIIITVDDSGLHISSRGVTP